MQKFPAPVSRHAQRIGLSLRMTKLMRRAAWLKRQGYAPDQIREQMGESNCPYWLAKADVEDLELALGIRYRPDSRTYAWRVEGAQIPLSLVDDLASSIVKHRLDALQGQKRTSSKEARARAGLPVTKNALPFGYRWGEAREIIIDGRKRLEAVPEPDTEEAHTVQLMFEWYMEGRSPRDIAARLNDLGRPGPRGREWSNETVRDILNNPFYAGYVRYRGTITDKSGNRKQPRYTGKLYSGLHEPLISLDEWDEMQQERFIRASRRSKSVSRPNYTIVGKPAGKRYFIEGGELTDVRMRDDI